MWWRGLAILQAVSRWLPSPRSNPGQVMWDLWWTKWHSEYFAVPLQSSFHQLLHNHHYLSSGAGTIGQYWPQ
jgi:hypothetical protein